jgi:uncharacterized protein (DUF342 family)
MPMSPNKSDQAPETEQNKEDAPATAPDAEAVEASSDTSESPTKAQTESPSSDQDSIEAESSADSNQEPQSEAQSEASEEENNKQPFASLALIMDGDDLVARLTPHDSDSPANKSLIMELVKQQKLEHIPLEDNSIKELLTKITTKETAQYIIGRRLHAKADVFISSDKMQCKLSIAPANGGDNLSLEQLTEQLNKEKIAEHLIDTEVLKSALEKSLNGEEIKQLLVAEGKEPVNGEDTQFTLLLNVPEHKDTTLEEDGTTNYYETRQYPSINIGTELMRKSEPTKGTPGYNVFGKEIKARNGKVIRFAKFKNAEIAKDDENLLVATMKGHPVIGPKSVSIDDILSLRNVDLSTGNIHFDGSVEVAGNVFPQMLVEASGDISVKGYVENATLISGSNILIGAGVISEKIDDDEELKFTSTLKAGGNIQALFFNQTDARANGDIIAKQYAMNSRLIATRKIIMGDGGGKGVLLGGSASAGESVEVNTLGSSAYIKTQLDCASKKRLQQHSEKIFGERERRQKELDQLQSFMEKVAGNKQENLGKVLINKTRKIEAAVKRLSAQLETLNQEWESITELVENADSATITIHKKMFPNSLITINDIAYHNNDERNQTTLTIKDDKVTHE